MWSVAISSVFVVNILCLMGKPVEDAVTKVHEVHEGAFTLPSNTQMDTAIASYLELNIKNAQTHAVPVQSYTVPSFRNNGEYAENEADDRFADAVIKATIAVADSGILAAQQILQTVRSEVLDAFRTKSAGQTY